MIIYWSKTMRSLETLKQFIGPFCMLAKCITYLKFGRMPSKEAVLAGIYRKCGNSPTLNVSIKQTDTSHFRTIE